MNVCRGVVYVCVPEVVCAYTWKPEVEAGYLPQDSPLYFQKQGLTEPGVHPCC